MKKKSAFDRSRLKRLQEALSRHRSDRGHPGMVALLDHDEETHCVAQGISRDTIFRITSMTKPITAVAALILVEECKLRLDDPVNPFLPEFDKLRVLRDPSANIDDTVPIERPITLRDLLTFRMGTGLLMNRGDTPIAKAAEGIVGFGAPDPSAQSTPDEWLKTLSELPLPYQPGERWMYNTAYYVLGVLIMRVTGKSLESFFRERIFEPLKMKDTGFFVPERKLRRLSHCYWFDSEKERLELFDGPDESLWAKPPAFEDAGAGLVSTVDDYLSFSRMLLNFGTFGKERILSRASIETMITDQLTPTQKSKGGLFPSDWEYRGFGFGVSIVTQQDAIHATPGQYGWDGGFGSSWRVDPKKGLIGIIMTERTFDSPKLPDAIQDFWTLGYSSLA